MHQLIGGRVEEKKSFDGEKVATTVILLILTAALFLGLGFQMGKVSIDTDSAVIATTTATALAAEKTAGWETFTYSYDPVGFFSLKYPSDTWAVDTDANFIDTERRLDNRTDARELGPISWASDSATIDQFITSQGLVGNFQDQTLTSGQKVQYAQTSFGPTFLAEQDGRTYQFTISNDTEKYMPEEIQQAEQIIQTLTLQK